MKFAFSTLACPAWDFETIATRAAEYGYHGVEIRAFLNDSVLSSANVFLTDPAKVRAIFALHKVEIACLTSSIAMTGDKKEDLRLAGDVKRFIDAAVELGCSVVQVADTQVRAGHGRAAAGGRLAQWLLPLADYAADRDVTLVVENLLSFRTAKELWMALEIVDHPSLGVCWDVFNAALVGEAPASSIPVLNNRIRHVHVKDAELAPLGARFTKLGEGQVALVDLFRRLRGIGFEGYASFEWEKAWLPNLAEPQEVLPHALERLREWTKPYEPPAPKAKPAPAAAAAAKA